MNHEERIRALERFYTHPQAGFVAMAALQSGFFMRRHYEEFSGGRAEDADDLLERILTLRHGRRTALDGRQVWHLCSRALYRSLGEPNNRHCRTRTDPVMRQKLLALGFAVRHTAGRYLWTEKEKLEFFCGELEVPRSCLPARVYRSKRSSAFTERYFVEKFPISVAGSTVTFCYIDEGVARLRGFDVWLSDHGPLFERLSGVAVVYAAEETSRFDHARRAFRRFAGIPEKYETYLELEDAFRKRDLPKLDAESLDRLKKLRIEFAVPKAEAPRAAFSTCRLSLEEHW